MKFVSLAPAVLLIAQNKGISISELVHLYQQMGFGGARSCRKLIHRLERLELIDIASGVRGDRREKAVTPTGRATQLLAELSAVLDRVLCGAGAAPSLVKEMPARDLRRPTSLDYGSSTR